MCGIAGIVHTDGRSVDRDVLCRMREAVAHRGPDGSGLWIDGPVGIAHRRLAIIDLSGGQQPMVSSDSGAVLAFNGEIYNYRDLRTTLRADGIRFGGDSDTEVVLRAFDRWGEACVERLHGMFAFAVWHPATQRLFAVRDRLGIKPLYYRWHDATLTFASEMKAILAARLSPAALDQRSFDRYLQLQYVPGPETMVDGVRQLPPGATLTIADTSGERGREPVVRRYWRARARASAAPTVEQFQERLAHSVRTHLVADVPVGALLSGGVDSSLVVAHMAALSPTPVHTFSVRFEDERLDESRAAKTVADHLGTVHHEELVTDRDAVEALPGVAAAMDEPLADYAALPTYLVARHASKHVKVVLSGEGADELFAGYRRYRRDRLLTPLSRLRAPYQASHVFSRAEVTRMRGRAPEPLRRQPRDERRVPGTLNRLLLRDIEGWLPDDLLVKVDRMTMLSSLEARVPYLDHEFVEWSLALPAAAKLSADGRKDKRLLRRAAATMLPSSVASRAKHGFKPPLDAWLRGHLRSLAHDALLSATARLRALVDIRRVEQLLAAHDRGRPEGHRLWTLLVWELWSREHGVA
jgi:asparagine synthase (glutamine-hydrolysing)